MSSPSVEATRAAGPAPPATEALPFRDPELPLAERIDDLLSRLTLAEKIGQMVHENSAIERLGLPAYNWWNEACHGVGRNGRATVFPQVIGLAATWNRALLLRVAGAIADEARVKHHAAVAAGRRGQYQGLTFWTPNVNIFRDPRWGRGQETFGEDPCLTGELGAVFVRGLQGDDARYLKVAACAKHFAVHSGPETERHTFDARPTPKDLAETYLPAFEKLVAARVEAVMGAYNRVLGEPACASRLLLVDILRGRWRFQGHVVSDCGAIDDIHRHHRITASAAESAARAVRMGCDLNCGCTFNDLVVAVCDGLIRESEIDVPVRRLLATKFRLGLFDPPEQVPYAALSPAIVDSDAHRTLARQAAAESIVLLKNAPGVLPLRADPACLLVVGPQAANIGALLGNYSGVSPQLVTFLEGIVERIDPNTQLEYRASCPAAQPGAPGVNYTFGAAMSSDVVIAFLGLDPTLEGEEGDAVSSLSGGDRDRIELPEVQRTFLLELRRHARTLILVLTGGSAIAVPEAHEICDAVLHAWYPGCEGGRALADVLFGGVSPSGKLPVTVPRRTADLPTFNDYRMRGRTYRFAEIEPLYPFGFGLSYTTFVYGALIASADVLTPGQELIVRTILANKGRRDGQDVVQCYLVPPQTHPDAPRATLVDFKKIPVAAGASVAVEFRLPGDAFRQVDATGRFVWTPGRCAVVVGSASPGARAVALGAPVPATCEIRLA
ncbi:MAG: glycoside hydrolase family 3 C-terminal domain-containing protein [Verrucomicrobia bacterium]|nr:glycoside hydrolase family 3 C-terminal domain-containing protein [Verrucomicrobiota bacterium]